MAGLQRAEPSKRGRGGNKNRILWRRHFGVLCAGVADGPPLGGRYNLTDKLHATDLDSSPTDGRDLSDGPEHRKHSSSLRSSWILSYAGRSEIQNPSQELQPRPLHSRITKSYHRQWSLWKENCYHARCPWYPQNQPQELLPLAPEQIQAWRQSQAKWPAWRHLLDTPISGYIPEGDHQGRFKSGKHVDGNGTTVDLDNGIIPDGEMSCDKDILTSREPSKSPGKPERVDHEKEWPPPNGLSNARIAVSGTSTLEGHAHTLGRIAAPRRWREWCVEAPGIGGGRGVLPYKIRA